MVAIDLIGALASLGVDVASTLFLFRVLYELYRNPNARALDACANLPLVTFQEWKFLLKDAFFGGKVLSAS